MDNGVDLERTTTTKSRRAHPLRGLFIAQFLGTFNDNAWKQLVILLAIAAAATEVEGQKHTAIAQIILMVPLMVISLPAGLLADRVSKRSVIVGMKVVRAGADAGGHSGPVHRAVRRAVGHGRARSARRPGSRCSARRNMGSCPRSCPTSGSRPGTACWRWGRTWRSSAGSSRAVRSSRWPRPTGCRSGSAASS